MHTKVAILGGGMAGLIAGWFYKKNSISVRIFTDKIGGWQNLANKPYKFGPRLLKVDRYSSQLLDFFNLQKKIVFHNIGYEYEINKFSEIASLEFQEKYALRTRESKPEKTHLSAGQNVIRCFDIDYDVVLQKIEEYLQHDFVIGKVTDIAKDAIRIDGKHVFSGYSKIISTLPYNLLVKITKAPFDLNSFVAFPTSFVYCNIKDQKLNECSDKYLYMYSIADEQFHRINFLGNSKAVCEYKGKFDINQAKSDRFDYIESTTIPFAQLKQNLDLKLHLLEDGNPIWLLGRYAQWKHGVVINDVLQRLNEEL